MFIYKITNSITKKSYIGVTRQNPRSRFSAHISTAKRNDPSEKSALYGAIRKYGREAFLLEVLAEASSIEEMLMIEKGLIAEHGTYFPNGYNLTSGGDGALNFVASPELRAKRSVAMKGKPKSPEHIAAVIAARHGKRAHSTETKQKLRLLMLGKKHTPEAIAKNAAGHRGLKQSLETISRRVATRRANGSFRATPQAIEKHRQAMLGRKASPQARASQIELHKRASWKAAQSLAHIGKRMPMRISTEVDRQIIALLTTGYSLSETVRLTKVSRRTVILRRDRMRTEGLSKSSDNEPSSPAGVIVIAALKAEQELGA